ncbi:MAG: hypothetical protein AAGJ09_08305 [Pseudomonadota bacterium]
MGAPQRTLSIADIGQLIAGFDISRARPTFATLYLGLESAKKSHFRKSDKQRAYDIARLRKAGARGTLHQLVLAESVLYALTGSYACLSRISKLLRTHANALSLSSLFHAWHCFMAVPFDRAETFSDFQKLKLDYHSRAIYQALLDQAAPLADAVPISQPNPNDRVKIGICVTQFMGRRHAPTAAALTLAETYLAMGYEVAILNQSLVPRAITSGFYYVGLAPKLLELDGVTSLQLQGGQADFFQNAEDEILPVSYVAFAEALDRFGVTRLISLGPGNLYADLAGRSIRNIAMPSTVDLSIGRPGAFACVRPLPAMRTRLLERLGVSKEQIIDVPSGFSLPNQQAAYERAELGLTDEDYAIAIVSNRLGQELSQPFLDKLLSFLAKAPSAKVRVFGTVGSSTDRLKAFFAAHRQIEFIGFAKDLPSVLSVFDAVLNPPRMGGGTSAAYAIAKGVNVFTLDNCDVANVVGPDFVYADETDLWDALLSASKDNTLGQAARTKALAQWKVISDQRGQAERLLAHARITAP